MERITQPIWARFSTQEHRTRRFLVVTVSAMFLIFCATALCEDLETGLVALYLFEDDYTDSSGNGYDGTVFGDADIGTDPVRGQVLFADGGYVQVDFVEAMAFTAAEDFTCAIWFNTSDAGKWQTIVRKSDAQPYFGFWVTPANIAHTSSRSAAGKQEINGKDLIEKGTWYHLATVQNGGDKRTFYVNGVAQGESLAWDANGTGKLFIATERPDSDPFKGMLDELGIWNRALSEAEINDLVEKGFAAAVEPGGKLTTAWGAVKYH